MPYLIERFTRVQDMKNHVNRKDKLHVDIRVLLQEGIVLELWGSAYDEPGDDWTEWRLLQNEKVLDSLRVAGY